jgi:hypothetical protein
LKYFVDAVVADPDGDSLSFSWSVTGGELINQRINIVEWIMPDIPGDYTITLFLDDGRGGQAELGETTKVLPLASEKIFQIHGSCTIAEDSYIDFFPKGLIWGVRVGDDSNNTPVRGFLNFGISHLSGAEIKFAKMEFNNFYIENDPYSIIEKIRLDSVHWGTDDITLEDYDLPGFVIGEYEIPGFTCGTKELINELNRVIFNGQDVFQVRLLHKGPDTNHDGVSDSITYGGIQTVIFTVSFIPPASN